MNKSSALLMPVVLVGLVGALAACGESTSTTTSVSTVASTTEATTAAVAGSFSKEDVPGLVLAESEGAGLVEGLLYQPTYSGTATLADVRHWTLVPPERLQAVGFADGYANLFFTEDFYSTNGKAGRSLVTAALLFETPEGAAQAVKVFADSRDGFWQEWQPLSPVPGANGIAQTGRCGTDNVTDIYPTIGFGMQVANVFLLIGSQGGAESNQPIPEDLMRSLAERLLARAKDRLAQIRAGG